ncbi:YqaJ viral recombinase family protein [Gordonia sp. PP30]|uniref:lambda exonuclease family protein n=1 Tax=Gordonia sp. PP30 TaxID=2935861 RepID=UPI001FFFA386|nr:lambda exonuclease family protein [Gordonia sp. PP30]UQE74230.1 YqaJ viral recombinase family protein [Gordonia sp. PP30]
MSLTVLPSLVQGTDEWHAQRRGIVTASVVGQLISQHSLSAIDFDCPSCGAEAAAPCVGKRSPAPIKSMHPERAQTARESDAIILDVAGGDTARGLMELLTAERITDWTDPTYVSDDMLRGIEDEPRARDLYTEHYDHVDEVGFMVRDDHGLRIGYSPDGVVGDDGLIEVKSRRQKKHLATILADQVPQENVAQLQCGLYVSGREWIDYVSYCGGMPLYVKRVYPDEEWQAAIVAAVHVFEATAADMIRTYHARTVGLIPTERTIEQEMFL